MGINEDGLPPPDLLCSMEPEELAVPLLQIVCALEDAGQDNQVHVANYLGGLQQYTRYGKDRWPDVSRAITEAWHWLVFRGLLAQRPDQSGQFMYVTRRGRRLRGDADPKRYLARNLLDDLSLRPKLADAVRGPFLRMELDAAVVLAFRTVELVVRALAGIGSEVTGPSAVMAQAFKVDPPGPLVCPLQHAAERQGTLSLFLGAMGRFRNVAMHGDVGVDDPREALELIAFANALVRLAEQGKAAAGREVPA